jgi:hypothetical protein
MLACSSHCEHLLLSVSRLPDHIVAPPPPLATHIAADVTLILTYLAQAAHDLVPEDVMEPVLQTVANNFVSDRSSAEVMAVGCVCMFVFHIYIHISTYACLCARVRLVLMGG